MTTTQDSFDTAYLILGGARSGKSGYAEEIAKRNEDKLQQEVFYIATAIPFDSEMEERIERHKSDRPTHWKSIEEPIHLAKALKQNSGKDKVVLVDCLTLWLNNLLLKDDEASLNAEIEEFLSCIDSLQGTVIFVSNEVGMGVIPMGNLSRKFVDESGRLHQHLAKKVEHILLMVAGIAMTVKGNKPF